MPSPTASDLRVFVPAKDFALSKAFYKALGWKLNWEDAELAEMEIADRRFLLQNYYKKEWADNFMIHVSIDDAQAWYELASSIIVTGKYLDAKVNPPAPQAYGAVVTHLCGPRRGCCCITWPSGPELIRGGSRTPCRENAHRCLKRRSQAPLHAASSEASERGNRCSRSRA